MSALGARNALDVVIDALERHGCAPRRRGDDLDARCPAHDDHMPSLSVRYDRAAGKVLLNCHTGCTSGNVIDALELRWADLFDHADDDTARLRALRPEIVSTYDYTDPAGQLLYQKLRYHPKDFRVRRPDGRGGWTWRIGDAPRVLYRLPDVQAAITAGRPILLVEGEKDADRVARDLRMVATCNYEGAAKDGQRPKWRPEYTEQLRGARLLIVADNDEAGLAHAHAAAAALADTAADVRIFRPAVDHPKADISDHLDAGHNIEDLVPVLRAAEPTPPPEPPDLPPLAAAAGRLILPGLPQEFWESRVVHRHIRDAAHSRLQVPDIVFYTILARLAAFCSHHIGADSGIGSRASLCFYAAILGYSGDGKTEGSKVAAELLPIPAGLDCEDALPLGSGEGLAEAYMGTVTEEIPVGNRGRTKRVATRRQVRHNALFFVDEGETLVRSMERHGATIGGIMRSAWSGTTIGQRNATDERTRVVRAGSYSLGLVIGLQPDVAIPLLADSHTGMPQRFCWSTGYDPTIPDQRVPWPGELPWDPYVIQTGVRTTIGFPEQVTAELHAAALARRRGEQVLDELDGQSPLMRVKLAALLALLDSRCFVTVDDWALSELVWDTSCGVRDELVKHAEQIRARESQARTDLIVDREVAKTLAVTGLEQSIPRVARLVAAKVHDTETSKLTHGQARQALASRDRNRYDAGIEYAAAQDWLEITDWGVKAGPSRPALTRGRRP